MAKLTKKKLLAIQPSAIGKMKEQDVKALLNEARKLYKAQEEKFSKYSETVFSPALDKMQEYYSDSGMRDTDSMTLNKARSEIFRIQEFFDSKTATIPGARKVAMEQDKKIFGINDSTGRPLKRMTLNERVLFWATYQEFSRLVKESYVRMNSNTIQQYLGEMIIGGRKGGFNEATEKMFDYETFLELKKKVDQAKQIDDWETANYEYGNDDILSGKRPN